MIDDVVLVCAEDGYVSVLDGDVVDGDGGVGFDGDLS